jgi:anti-sigma28 factor (negative regulator of flagellin synthesis)
MKITRSTEVHQPVTSRTEPRARAPVAHTDGGATKASLSPDAAFVRGVREEAAASKDVRPDVVADAKAALASGKLESQVDMNKVVDSLISDL